MPNLLSPTARVTGGVLLAVAYLAGSGQEAGAECHWVIPDEEVHCTYHPFDPDQHNIVFLDTRTGATRAADLSAPNRPAGLILEPFVDLGWTPGVASVAPGLDRLLVARSKPSCPAWNGVRGAGLGCSYGRPTLWLAEHRRNDEDDPTDDLWVHTNLTRRFLGQNSEVHGWSTWLHEDRALFNALVFPDAGGWYSSPATGYEQEKNAAQIYSLEFSNHGDITVEAFAPAELWRENCLTGRVSAQLSSRPGGCTPGQRLSIVRRCYDEPRRPSGWAWWNSHGFDGGGGTCIAGAEPLEVPVLRVYVVELNRHCRPRQAFEELKPVRQPPDTPVHRQMGQIAEWGDMLAAISPDGKLIAMATNQGDPEGDLEDSCAAFHLHLTTPTDPYSGQGLRWTHLCRLASDRRCESEPWPIETTRTPPESTPLPDFVALRREPDPAQALVYTRSWNDPEGQPRTDIASLSLANTGSARIPQSFRRLAVGAQAIPQRTPIGAGTESDCAWPPGHGHFCRDCGPCQPGQGDCDGDQDCASGAVCGNDLGASHGFAPRVDVCVAPGETEMCSRPAGHGHFCRDCAPCQPGQGDCDSDQDCVPGSVCAQNVGPEFGFGPAIDVCVESETGES